LVKGANAHHRFPYARGGGYGSEQFAAQSTNPNLRLTDHFDTLRNRLDMIASE